MSAIDYLRQALEADGRPDAPIATTRGMLVALFRDLDNARNAIQRVSRLADEAEQRTSAETLFISAEEIRDELGDQLWRPDNTP